MKSKILWENATGTASPEAWSRQQRLPITWILTEPQWQDLCNDFGRLNILPDNLLEQYRDLLQEKSSELPRPAECRDGCSAFSGGDFTRISRTDLAVLDINSKDLPVATLGDSDQLEVGEWAIAIGSPFGLEHTVTVGVISAKGRSGLGTGTYEDFIQTDASINPGNSGGPLINIDGDVIGINAMIIQPGTGIGFAIPINMAKQILNDLIKQGKVVRPWLGISVQDLTPEMMEHFKVHEKEGVLVGQVYPDTGAEKAGMVSGDIIKSVDDKPVKNVNELVKEILKKKVGQKVKVDIIRDGKETTLEVTTSAQPDKLESGKEEEKETEEKLGRTRGQCSRTDPFACGSLWDHWNQKRCRGRWCGEWEPCGRDRVSRRRCDSGGQQEEDRFVERFRQGDERGQRRKRHPLPCSSQGEQFLLDVQEIVVSTSGFNIPHL